MSFSRQAETRRAIRWAAVISLALPAIGMVNRGQARAEGPAIRPTEARPDVLWTDAKHLVGRYCYVSGKVTDFYEGKSVYLLNVGDAKAREFTIVIPTDHLPNFPKKPSLLYVGKYVRVYGMVSTYRGGPQIFAGSPDRFQVLEEMPQLPSFEKKAVPLKDQITVATYNILNLFDHRDDPFHNDEFTRTKPRAELMRLAETIRRIDADVLALQEVESRGYLARFLEVFLSDMGYEHVVHFEGNDLRGIDVCLVSRVPIGEVRSYRHVEFPDGERRPMNLRRDLLCVQVTPPAGVPFEVWVVHLKSKSGREHADKLRIGEARFIRKLLDEQLKGNPDARIIVCGDFNDTWDSKALRTIVGSGPTAMKCFAEEIPEEERITYNKEPYRSMIDFILCSPRMAERYVKGSYRILSGTVDSSGSDHNAVSARFLPSSN